MRYYLGIDPGGSGGLAAISSSGSGRIHLLPLKDREPSEVWDWFRQFGDLALPGTDTVAIMEQVGGYIPYSGNGNMEGKNTQPGHQMFKFGKSAGLLQGFLVAAGIWHESVIPRTWQKRLGVEPRRRDQGETQARFKSRLKTLATSLFPSVKLNLQTCDALLLAEYCRRIHEGR